MLLMLVLIVMIISVALLMALLSGFFPFLNTYGNVVQYSTAYYGAISALERGALAIRYAGPGFDGESGRKAQNNGTPINTGKQSDQRLEDFYTYGNGNDSLLWSVKSSTDRIPVHNQGNVDPAFIDKDNPESRNYNMLNYATTELLPLGTISSQTAEQYYTSNTTFTSQTVGEIQGNFRLNPFLFTAFSGGIVGDQGKLCTERCANEQIDWRDENQVVTTRTLKGEYKDNEFTLLPKDGTNLNREIIQERDSLIRKKNITQGTSSGTTMTFAENSHPFPEQYPSTTNELNIISNNEAELTNLGTFKKIFSDGDTKNIYLSLSLANYLWTKGKNLYPFLEYEFHTTDGSKIADRFYAIQGEGKVGKYNVRLQVQKPTLKQPALGNFTIIF